MAWTTSELIQRIKDIAVVPGQQPAYNDSSLLRILDDKLQAVIIPWMMTFAEEYFVTYADQAITTTKSRYRVPSAAIGGKLREIKIVDSAGNVEDIERVEITNAERFTRGWYWLGNTIILLHPENHAGKTMRMYYYKRPGELVAVTSCGQISSTTPGAYQATCTSVPVAWGASIVVDVIQGSPPFDTLVEGVTATLAGSTLTLAAADWDDDISVGDWVTLTGYTPIAQIPAEVQPMLCQAVVIQILSSLGDGEDVSTATSVYGEYADAAKSFLANRTTGEKKIVCVTDGLLNRQNIARWSL